MILTDEILEGWNEGDINAEPSSPRRSVLSFRVTNEERRYLEETTRQHNISLSAILREGLNRAMTLSTDDLRAVERKYRDHSDGRSRRSAFLLRAGR